MRRERHKLPDVIVPNEEAQRVARDRAVLATFTNVDFQRARFWCLTASVAVNFPRRLGADSSRQELSADKRTSRKVCSAYREVWRLIHLEQSVPPPPEWSNWPVTVIDPMANRIGATVMWESQVSRLLEVVNRRMHSLTELEEIARYDGMDSWYNKHGEVLDWEMNALLRVQTHINTKRPV